MAHDDDKDPANEPAQDKEANLRQRAMDTANLLLTGRSTVRHGTSRRVADIVRQEGLVARGSRGVSDEIPGLAEVQGNRIFLSRDPNKANIYGRQQAALELIEGMDDATLEEIAQALRDNDQSSGAFRKLRDMVDPIYMDALAPKSPINVVQAQTAHLGRDVGGDVLKVRMPWKSLQEIETNQVEPATIFKNMGFNVEALMANVDDQTRGRNAPAGRYGRGAERFGDVFVAKDRVPSSAIVGGDGYSRVTGEELVDHIKNVLLHPLEFSKEVGRQATGRQHRGSRIMAEAEGSEFTSPSDWGVWKDDTVKPIIQAAVGVPATAATAVYLSDEDRRRDALEALKNEFLYPAGTPQEQAWESLMRKFSAAKPRYRNRVTLFITNDKGEVLVAKGANGIEFPGGGTENGKVNDAAQREALEEVGYAVTDVKPLGVSPVLFKFPADFKKKQVAKGRDHDGWRNYIRCATAKKRDKSLLGSEGDAKKGVKFIPIEDAITDYKKRCARKNNEWKLMDKQTLAALEALSAKQEKEASFWQRAKDTANLALTGRSTLRHGTSKRVADIVKQEGLVARGSRGVSDEISGLAEAQGDRIFLSRNPAMANAYGSQQEGLELLGGVEGGAKDYAAALRDADRQGLVGRTVSDLKGKLIPSPPTMPGAGPSPRLKAVQREIAVAGRDVGGETLRVRAPWHQIRKMETGQVEPMSLLRDNAVVDAIDTELGDAMGAASGRFGATAVPVSDAFVANRSIPSNMIVGGKGYSRPGRGEIADHFKSVAENPVGFAKELGRQFTGVEHRPSTIMANTVGAPSSNPRDYGISLLEGRGVTDRLRQLLPGQKTSACVQSYTDDHGTEVGGVIRVTG